MINLISSQLFIDSNLWEHSFLSVLERTTQKLYLTDTSSKFETILASILALFHYSYP